MHSRINKWTMMGFLLLASFLACDRDKPRPRRKALLPIASNHYETIIEPPVRKIIIDRSDDDALDDHSGGIFPLPPPPPPPPIPIDDDDFPLPPPIGPLSICGNGRRELHEHCDDGPRHDDENVRAFDNTDGCNIICKFPFCGNGVRELGEECDDNNKISGDGCSDRCQFERCGNKRIDQLSEYFREECDDGNKRPGDGCSPCCTIERCGNGIIDFNEECDDGNLKNGDGCDDWCKREPEAAKTRVKGED